MSSRELPCLAFHDHDDHSTAFYTVSEQNLVTVALNIAGDDVLQNKTICPTAKGFLLARDPDTMATFLWCPQNGDQIHLPPLEGLDDGELVHSHCLLSDEPSVAGCVVFLVEGDKTFIWYCRLGDDKWVKHEYDVQTVTLPHEYNGSYLMKIPIYPIAACGGKFYFNAGNEDLRILEFSPDPAFSSMTVDYDSYDDEEEDEEHSEGGGRNLGAAVFLVESGGELYRVTLVFAAPCSREISDWFIQKMDFSERRWRDVVDLGGRTFLLSQFYFGASCSGSEGGLRQDCIYLVRKDMQVFDLKEGTSDLLRLDEAPQFAYICDPHLISFVSSFIPFFPSSSPICPCVQPRKPAPPPEREAAHPRRVRAPRAAAVPAMAEASLGATERMPNATRIHQMCPSCMDGSDHAQQGVRLLKEAKGRARVSSRRARGARGGGDAAGSMAARVWREQGVDPAGAEAWSTTAHWIWPRAQLEKNQGRRDTGRR
ncbi:hypothetical protein HU200_054214 [Digitaria exilis]|uniref:KIB1-4 beta-propeller domain-containing protein n=1 Tax=Digitaria exilis TaxID=1010633 RepID=A0A835AQK6_9POAL|nr:hypothetical protein HU200_054214 [Digitaria exilis]